MAEITSKKANIPTWEDVLKMPELANPKLGPGPTPSYKITDPQEQQEFIEFFKKLTKFPATLIPGANIYLPGQEGITITFNEKGMPDFSEFDGVLHRDARVTPIAKYAAENLKELTGQPVALTDAGGHLSGLVAWKNFFKSPKGEKDKAVVVLNFGAFGKRWATDLAKDDMGLDVINVEVPDGTLPTMEEINEAIDEHLKANEIPKDTKVNITYTAHETSSGVMMTEELAKEINESPRFDKIIVDTTSALGCQNIPGMKDGRVAVFGGLQKVLRAPALGIVTVPEAYRYRESALAAPSSAKVLSLVGDDGKLKEDLFDGSNITRSTSAIDLAKLTYALYNLDKETKEKVQEESIINTKYCHEALEKYIEKQKDTGNQTLDFLVKDPKIRGNFNLVIECATPEAELSTKDLKKIREIAHTMLAENGQMVNVKPYPGGSNPRTLFRFTTMGVESKQEAQQIIEMMGAAFYKAKELYFEAQKSKETTKISFKKEREEYLATASAGLLSSAISTEKYSPFGLVIVCGAGIKEIKSDPILEKLAKYHGYAVVQNKEEYNKAINEGKNPVLYNPNIESKDIADFVKDLEGKVTIHTDAKSVDVSDLDKIVNVTRGGSGHEHIKVTEGAAVSNMPGVNAPAVLDLMTRKLNEFYKILDTAQQVSSGSIETRKTSHLQYGAETLTGKNILVDGNGNIASSFINYAQSMKANITVYLRSPDELEETKKLARVKEIATLREQGITVIHDISKVTDGSIDIMTIHRPGGEKTKDSIGKEWFDKLAANRKSLLMNLSRESICNLEEFTKAYESNTKLHFYGDFDSEISDSKTIGPAQKWINPLNKIDSERVTITAHIHADTNPAIQQAMLNAALLMTKGLAAGVVCNPVRTLPEGEKSQQISADEIYNWLKEAKAEPAIDSKELEVA